MAAHPHDALFKAALSRPENAVGALRANLPPALLAQLDLGTLRLTSNSFVRADLAQLHADLVYEVQVAGRPGLACFILHEHQSSHDPQMVVRVFLYVATAWAQWLEAHPDANRVPAIIPVVLYHGERPWTAATSLRDMIDLPEAGLLAAGDLLPSLRFVLDDLCRVPDDDLRVREAGVFGRLAMLLLKHARSVAADRGDSSALELLASRIQDLLVLLPDRGDRVRAFCYMIDVVSDADPAALLAVMGPGVAPQLREDLMTAGERLRLEGLLEGQRRLVLRQLRRKFSTLSEDALTRVATADEETLARWADAVLDATSLDEVWSA